MKIVLDSNLIMAAFATRGLCAEIFEFCIERHDVYVCDQILSELNKNFEKKLKMPQDKIRLIIQYLKDHCNYIEDIEITERVSRDPDDDGIISLAVKSDSTFIVTGDKDLLVLKKYKQIQILTPREFWEVLKQKID